MPTTHETSHLLTHKERTKIINSVKKLVHERRDSIPPPYSINATLRPVDTTHGKRWMFVDVIEDGVASQAGIRPGEFLLSIDSEPVVPPKTANFRIGGNHNVEIGTFNGNKRQVTFEIPNRAAKDR